MLNKIENINNEYMFPNIMEYFSETNLKNICIVLSNTFEKTNFRSEKISYCIINCSESLKITYLLDNISDNLENGSIILFTNWFNNINEKGKGTRDTVLEWLNDNELIELIDFPIHSWKQKSFIFRRNTLEYTNWSD